jgi:prepilin-type N-terminal cleavage/methylation domain-containing protein
MSKKSIFGFTMIELLMAMTLMALMSMLALTQFIDYRNEGKLTQTRKALNAIRVGFLNQKAQLVLRCNRNYPFDVLQLFTMLYMNDSTAVLSPLYTGPCTAAQVPNSIDRKVTDSILLPANPFLSPDHTAIMGTTLAMRANHCLPCHSTAVPTADGRFVGWCVDMSESGGVAEGALQEIWANSNLYNECSL